MLRKAALTAWMGSSKTYEEKRWEVEMENEQRGDIGRESRRWREGTVCVYLRIKTKKAS